MSITQPRIAQGDLSYAMSDYVDSRELALLILGAIFFAWMISRRSIRGALGILASSFVLTRLLPMFVVLGLNALAVVWLIGEAGFWERTSWDVVVLWYLGAGFETFRALGDAPREPHYVRKILAKGLGAGFVITTFVNLQPFGLVAELIAIPLVIFVSLVAAFAGQNPEQQVVAKMGNFALKSFGAFLILYGSWKLITNFSTIDWADVAREFAVPVLLSVGTLPYFCGLRLQLGISELFIDVNMDAKRVREHPVEEKNAHPKRAKAAVLIESRLRVRRLLDWGKQRPLLRRLLLAETLREAREIAREHEVIPTVDPA